MVDAVVREGFWRSAPSRATPAALGMAHGRSRSGQRGRYFAGRDGRVAVADQHQQFGAVGALQFILDGDRFGGTTTPAQHDLLLWMQLVHLGYRFAETYWVLPSVSDPDHPAHRQTTPGSEGTDDLPRRLGTGLGV